MLAKRLLTRGLSSSVRGARMFSNKDKFDPFKVGLRDDVPKSKGTIEKLMNFFGRGKN